MQDLLAVDPREAFLTHEFEGFHLAAVSSFDVVCTWCEIGQHEVDSRTIMQCECPCHGSQDIGPGHNR